MINKDLAPLHPFTPFARARLTYTQERRIHQDIEEARFQAEKRREAIQRARVLQYAQTERVKGLQSAMLLTEVLRERELQKGFRSIRYSIIWPLCLFLIWPLLFIMNPIFSNILIWLSLCDPRFVRHIYSHLVFGTLVLWRSKYQC